MAIDAEGNVWSNNNFIPGSQSVLIDPKPGAVDVLAYTGTGVTKLRSDGHPLSPPTGFLGGGTFGGAFGMAIDRRGHAWVGNFAGDSLTELAPDGTPLSPDSSPQYGPSGGYRTEPPLHSPQSILFDQTGDLWVTNLMGGTVTQLIGADPSNVRTWGPGCPDGFLSPWGLASDAQGRIWVTDSRANTVARLDPAAATTPPFCPAATFPLSGPGEPQGLAVDPVGNVWVANTAGGNVQLLEAASGFTPARVLDGDGSIVGPWSVAVDGIGNVWVADFFGKRIVQLCGATGSCPAGLATGDPISPPGDGGGYGASGAVESITAIEVDQAGNVWVANNFDQSPVCLLGTGAPRKGERTTVPLEQLQPRCAGNGAAVTFGVAAPVRNPLIGPARAP